VSGDGEVVTDGCAFVSQMVLLSRPVFQTEERNLPTLNLLQLDQLGNLQLEAIPPSVKGTLVDASVYLGRRGVERSLTANRSVRTIITPDHKTLSGERPTPDLLAELLFLQS